MRKVIECVKSNIKIIVIIALLAVLIGAVYFFDKGKKDKNASSVSSVSVKSEKEVKLTALLSSIGGVGKTDVMINESEGTIQGVVIVCEGANNIMIRNNILNAVSTALNVNKKIIAIYSMSV